MTEEASGSGGPQWQPLSAIQRRVVGVLAEKAKTTPESYPMSLNAVVVGCNQKTNRFPVSAYEADAVEETLDELRELRAVVMIEGVGRVPKYRHLLYQWLGVEKVELAVMTELLLRGAQTEGELRSRAARMEPIADVAVLRPVLDSLKRKGLIVSLTPEGRGHVITHNLYKPRELEQLRAQYAAVGAGVKLAGLSGEDDSIGSPAAGPEPCGVAAADSAANREVAATIDALRADVERLRAESAALSERQVRLEAELQRLRSELGCT